MKSLDLSLEAFAVHTLDTSLPDFHGQYLIFESNLDVPGLEHLDLSNWTTGRTPWLQSNGCFATS
jgi:hypothetical protein